MENRDKNYLFEELSGKEKKYLLKIIMSARYRYLDKNKEYIDYKVVQEDIPDNSTEPEVTINIIFNRYDESIKSANEFEKLFTDERLYKVIKALSLKEKTVLFSFYKENKNMTTIARELGVTRQSVYLIKQKAEQKILNSLLKGEEGYV